MGETEVLSQEPAPPATLLSNNPHTNWPASNPGLHDERLNHLNLGTALKTNINPNFTSKFRSYRAVNTLQDYETSQWYGCR
jgi:hypothetical protein